MRKFSRFSGRPGASVRAGHAPPTLLLPVLGQIIANPVSGRILPAISYLPVRRRSPDFDTTSRSLEKRRSFRRIIRPSGIVTRSAADHKGANGQE